MPGYLSDYASVGVIVLAGVALSAAMLGANRVFRPRAPSPDKTTTYESGVDPEGDGWAQSTIRYYVYAFLYVVFAVDAIFLFPWAVVFADIGWKAAGEMAAFLAFIGVGLVYAWRKGVLTWTR